MMTPEARPNEWKIGSATMNLSSGEKSATARTWATLDSSEACVWTTPFGFPSEPEVNNTIAGPRIRRSTHISPEEPEEQDHRLVRDAHRVAQILEIEDTNILEALHQAQQARFLQKHPRCYDQADARSRARGTHAVGTGCVVQQRRYAPGGAESENQAQRRCGV